MKYAALFRGLNIRGKNLVPMKELKQMLLDLGLSNVNTYIQSGNAVFDSELHEASLFDMIETAFQHRFGFKSNVLLRTIDEIRELIEKLPITPEEIAEAHEADPQVEHLYVYFLASAPEAIQMELICREHTDHDILLAGKRELYLLCRQSVRLSSLAIRASKTFPAATVRNFKTVNKLYELLCNM